MTTPFDWNDIRVFLAVAETGSTLAASRTLGLSQSTVARRVVAMEAALGLRIFDKRRTGYALTEAGEMVMPAARSAAAAALTFEARAAAQSRDLSGTVRLTTSEAFADRLLDRAVAEFRAQYPAIQVEIVASPRRLNLADGEAEVALRAGGRPTEPDLVGRRIAIDIWSVYCSRDYAARHGVPNSAEELASHRVVGLARDGAAPQIAAWLRDRVPDSAVVLRRDSIEGLYAGIANGTGVAPMSDFLAASDPGLVRCFTPQPQAPAEIWLLTHERLRSVPRVRALVDFLNAYFDARKHLPSTAEPGRE